MTDFQSRLQHALDADFLIEREIGGGGMSRVFLATERALQRRVVIKVLPPDLAAGVNVERFRREIQLAAQLQHPHIVPVLAAGDDDALLWYSMPYIDGESLRGAIKRQGRLPVRDVVRILHDVVDALAYAHARGIVHRDIKPDNILTSGMHALVTDFGVAKALSAAIPLHGGTTTGMAIGTPAYMAPEQLAADPAADHRVDLYAVGLLGYELLTGTSPFTGTSPQATLAAQLTLTPPAPHTALSEIPEALSRVIMHCLEKDANKRPASAQALLAELDALPPLTGRAKAGAAPSSPRRWPMAVAAVLLLVASLSIAQRLRRNASEAATTAAADTLAARDVGPGGARNGDGALTAVAGADTTQIEPGSAAFRDSAVGSDAADGARTTAVPVTLSRAESLAIMEVMLKRQSAARADAKLKDSSAAATAPTVAKGTRIIVRSLEDPKTEVTVDREALLSEVRRIFSDSMSYAMQRIEKDLANLPRDPRFDPRFDPRNDPSRSVAANAASAGLAAAAGAMSGLSTGIVPLIAPPTDGRTRVVISNYTNATGKREFSNLGREAAAAIRAAIPADKFDVVDNATTDRATRLSADRVSLGWGLRADVVVSGVISQRGDSIEVMTILTEVRGGRFSRSYEIVVPSVDAKRALDPSAAKVSMWLDSARTMMSRRPPGGPRPASPSPATPPAAPPAAPPAE